MKPRNDRTQLAQPRPALSASPRQRFRIDKLEERIAPHVSFSGGHYNPKTKWVTGVPMNNCI